MRWADFRRSRYQLPDATVPETISECLVYPLALCTRTWFNTGMENNAIFTSEELLLIARYAFGETAWVVSTSPGGATFESDYHIPWFFGNTRLEEDWKEVMGR